MSGAATLPESSQGNATDPLPSLQLWDPDGPIWAGDRNDTIWLKDGNIVLIASGARKFRLYKGLLAYHSSVFNDMFSIPEHDISPEDTLDGCPVVHLPDPPDTLNLFLLILVTSGFGSIRWLPPWLPESLPFSEFAGLLRIAHKYQAFGVLATLRDAFVHLGRSSRVSWSLGTPISRAPASPRAEGEGGPTGSGGTRRLGGRFLDGKPGSFSLIVWPDNAIEAVNLAHLVDMGKPTLAAMLWQCCLQEPSRLRDGIPRDDGVLERLSDEDYVRCVTAQPKLLLHCRDSVVQTVLFYASVGRASTCTGRYNPCAGFSSDAAMNVLRGYMKRPRLPALSSAFICIDYSFNNKMSANDEYYGDSRTYMCADCWCKVTKRHQSVIDEFWQNLPDMFNL
ncbi:hypothetical protein OH77DRAFT_1431029 [Trametes cingulata]|nr:hypothetical protein OH77DRAFT_1431029 [Trametes cingulata]